jgi:hypothetical protein
MAVVVNTLERRQRRVKSVKTVEVDDSVFT